MIGGGIAAAAGVAAAPVIGIIAGALGLGVAGYTFARSQGANINVPAVDKLLRVFNLGAEAVEEQSVLPPSFLNWLLRVKDYRAGNTSLKPPLGSQRK